MSERVESGLAEQAPVQQPPSEKKGKRRILILCLVSLVNVGLLVLLVTQLLTPTTHTATDPLIGHPAPDFSLALLHPSDGQTTLALANVKGKPVVLNFWASWCAPCKEELPLLEQTWQQQQGQGTSLVFLGMDFQESSSDAATFLQHYRITYPIVLDTNGEAAQQYHVTALPQTIFINREGTVVWRIPGELTAKTLSNGLRMIL